MVHYQEQYVARMTELGLPRPRCLNADFGDWLFGFEMGYSDKNKAGGIATRDSIWTNNCVDIHV